MSQFTAGGMGFVADVCENIVLNEYKIKLKEGRDEYFTTTVDGVFISNCSGNFIMRNSRISDTYDDAVNIHGYYTVIEEIIDNKTVKLSHPHPAHNGFIPCFDGDEIHFSEPDTLDEIG